MDLENLRGKDPFNELDDWADDEPAPAQSSLVHIRIQQRNGRKTLTTCQGIPEQFDLPRIMKAFKKVRLIFTFARAVNGRLIGFLLFFPQFLEILHERKHRR